MSEVSSNTEIQKELASSLEVVRLWLESGGDLVKEQAPLVCEEIVRYGIVYHSVGVIVGVVMIIIGLISVRAVMRFANTPISNNVDDEALAVMFAFLWITTLSTIITGIVFLLINTPQLIMALTAPRLYVIKAISNLF